MATKLARLLGQVCASRRQDPNFCQVVAVDAEFGVFGRAWCMEAQPTLTSTVYVASGWYQFRT